MSGGGSATALRIATRESPLALWQARHVASLIRQRFPEQEGELVPLSTMGDRDRREALSRLGGQGVFTREIQQAVLNNRADLAVHSLKDLPTVPTEGLVLAGVPEREIRYDALVLPKGTAGTLESLAADARIGTGSPRRQAQLRRMQPSWNLAEIRGNVETRLRKLDEGEYDAILLAEAGLIRLGLADRISQRLQPPDFYPAVGQAALGIECRSDDPAAQQVLAALCHSVTMQEVTAERACLATLKAGCHAPVGVYGRIEGAQLMLSGVVLSLDGVDRFFAEESIEASIEAASELGALVATRLIEQGAGEVIRASENQEPGAET